MYVLLLHRKYFLYSILTEIGIGAHNDLSELMRFKSLLFEYQTDYAYERITEVPQYHKLYKKVEEQLDLKTLFEDVLEPIDSMSELRKEIHEEELTRKNEEIERAISLLSILTVFSALIDSYSYVEAIQGDLSNLAHTSPMLFVHIILSTIIIGTAIYVIRRLKTKQGKRKKGNNKLHAHTLFWTDSEDKCR